MSAFRTTLSARIRVRRVSRRRYWLGLRRWLGSGTQGRLGMNEAKCHRGLSPPDNIRQPQSRLPAPKPDMADFRVLHSEKLSLRVDSNRIQFREYLCRSFSAVFLLGLL